MEKKCIYIKKGRELDIPLAFGARTDETGKKQKKKN